MKTSTLKSIPATDSPVLAATKLISEVRARCMALGLTPEQFADLLLSESLLALMVAGMRQEEVEAVFSNFARDEVPAWFLQVKRTVGYCDCEREALGEHEMYCSARGQQTPVVQHLLNHVAPDANG